MITLKSHITWKRAVCLVEDNLQRRKGQIWAHEAAIAPWLGLKMETDKLYNGNY